MSQLNMEADELSAKIAELEAEQNRLRKEVSDYGTSEEEIQIKAKLLKRIKILRDEISTLNSNKRKLLNPPKESPPPKQREIIQCLNCKREIYKAPRCPHCNMKNPDKKRKEKCEITKLLKEHGKYSGKRGKIELTDVETYFERHKDSESIRMVRAAAKALIEGGITRMDKLCDTDMETLKKIRNLDDESLEYALMMCEKYRNKYRNR